MHILNSDAAPLKNLDLEVVGDRILPLRSISYIHLDSLVPNGDYTQIQSGCMLAASLRYDPDIETTDVEFRSQPFSVNQVSWEDDSKPSQ